jgi:hypothetical protein
VPVDTSVLVQEPSVANATGEVDAEALGTGPQGKPLSRERVQVVEDRDTRRALEAGAIAALDKRNITMLKRSCERVGLTDRRGSVGRGTTR